MSIPTRADVLVGIDLPGLIAITGQGELAGCACWADTNPRTPY